MQNTNHDDERPKTTIGIKLNRAFANHDIEAILDIVRAHMHENKLTVSQKSVTAFIEDRLTT